MKTMFVYAKSKKEVVLPDDVVSQLPRRVGIVSTIQYLHRIGNVKRQLPESVLGGQVLGCRADNAQRIASQVDAFLYIGTGEFHPIEVAMTTGKPVFFYNPVTNAFGPLDKRTVDSYKTHLRGQQLKFLTARRVGILVSTKLGQNDNKINPFSQELKMRAADELRKLPRKEWYVFAFDTLRQHDLADFPFIDCWVNSACSRIADEKSDIVNIKEALGWMRESLSA